MIAASLAFALSSAALAAAPAAPAATPTLKLFLKHNGNVTNTGTEDKSAEFKIKWTQIGDLYAPTTTSDQQLTNLTFITKGNSSTTNVIDSQQTVGLPSSPGGMTKLIVDGGNKGIQMGNDGKGTLGFDSDKLVYSSAHMELKNLGNGENSTAFKGNLDLRLGMDAHVNAEFNGNVEGNITLKFIHQNVNKQPNIFTFKGKDGLKGNISTDFGSNQFIFEKGGITGNISIDSSFGQYSGGVNSFTFKEENATIKGNILVDVHPNYNYTKANAKINFEKNGKIEADQIMLNSHLVNNTGRNQLSIDGQKSVEINAKEILVTGYGQSSLSIKATEALKITTNKNLSIKGNYYGSHNIVLEGGKGSQIKTPWLHNDGDENYYFSKPVKSMINIKLSGKTQNPAPNATDAANSTFLEANIKNSYGHTNIILEDAEWKSYDPKTKTSGILQHSGLANDGRPEINLVMRNTTGTPLAQSNNPNNYRIIANNQNRDTNVVLEGAHNTTFDVSYGGNNLWSTNFIFAASHTGKEQNRSKEYKKQKQLKKLPNNFKQQSLRIDLQKRGGGIRGIEIREDGVKSCIASSRKLKR